MKNLILQTVKNRPGLSEISLFEKIIGRIADCGSARESGRDSDTYSEFNKELVKLITSRKIRAVNSGYNSYKYF